MLSRLKKTFLKEPESSLTLRYVILAAMLVPLLALVRTHSGLWPHVIIAAIGITAGHWYSYRNLEKQKQLVRGMMFVAIHAVFVWMFVGLIQGLTVPQAQFAIFAQAVTSFDLRYRSSLFNTLIHSLAILYVAASLSRSIELGLYLIIFAALVLAAFFIAAKESGIKRATIRPKIDPTAQPARPRALTTFSFSFGAMALLGVFLVFLVTPRFANRPLVPPFTINVPLSGGITAEIINPGVPLVQVNGWSDEVGDYYFGFDTDLDLRYRGGLSDNIVMYVRSPSKSYWRSHSYDYYDGVTWSQSDKDVTEVKSRHGVYFKLPAPLGSPQSQGEIGFQQEDGSRVWYSDSARQHLEDALILDDDIAAGMAWQNHQQVVQSFTIVREQPNLVFAAYRPLEFFIVSENLSLDSSDGIRVPKPLEAGMTYSVVSYRPNFEPEALRQASTTYPAEISARYLQLPVNISQRVKDLAQSLAAPHDNAFDKVTALNNHLLTYPYDFFPPAHPPGAEVVDNFLFEDKRGFCEMYVTSLVVMARSLDIPARMTTGYGSGRYNPITDLYEVRFSDAHSWAEIYFPGHGWVPFDPTPGWEPQPYPTPVQTWLFSDNGRLFNQLMDLNLPIAAMASGGAAAATILLPILFGVAIIVGLAALALFLSRRLRQWFVTWMGNRYTPMAAQDQRRKLILKIYHQAMRLLRKRKNFRKREAWETIGEYSPNLGDSAALARLNQLAEVAAYRPAAPDAEQVEQAKQALAALKSK